MTDLMDPLDEQEGQTKGREGRVAGVRLTVEQAEALWELALGGFEGDAKTIVTYEIGGDSTKARTPARLWPMLGDREALDNLRMEARQQEPYRHVTIQLGPGKWTTYTVRAEDPTWALGRYEELTEWLVARQSFLVRVDTKRPEIALTPPADAPSRKATDSDTTWASRDVWSPRPTRPWETPTSLAIMLIWALAVCATVGWLSLVVGQFTGRNYMENGSPPITPADLSQRGFYLWSAIALGAAVFAVKRATALKMRTQVQLKPRKEYDTGTVISIAAAVVGAVGTVLQLFK
ncbi:hypothetical protein [Microbispora sp. KK1-11]|uniref:hypothetical protein n=1 Tax=Microbispora sp. KK1-11 TaxID=2053005 RepID=UPI00115790E9|nr:hypothetical protein [Microbispora sp. KK1-11]TQS29117.1 hypothetical protein FLW16_12285 [Microbispora sp. KK1-11]